MINGGSLEDGYQGILLLKDVVATGKNVTDVVIDGTSFDNLLSKGIYAETLDGTSLFDNLVMNNVGEWGRIPTFGGSPYGRVRYWCRAQPEVWCLQRLAYYRRLHVHRRWKLDRQ